jgi:hypothetical protein
MTEKTSWTEPRGPMTRRVCMGIQLRRYGVWRGVTGADCPVFPPCGLDNAVLRKGHAHEIMPHHGPSDLLPGCQWTHLACDPACVHRYRPGRNVYPLRDPLARPGLRPAMAPGAWRHRRFAARGSAPGAGNHTADTG